MNWRLEKACTIAIKRYDKPNRTILNVRAMADSLDRFCIGLCLLNEGLIASLDLVDEKELFRFQRSAGDDATVEFHPAKVIVGFDMPQLYNVHGFTLRAVRDGMAPVNHIDIELIRWPQETIGLCIKYPHVAPPMSPEEARRRLGL
jgi:hypothetical protein